MAINLTLSFDGARVDGVLDGRNFAIVQRGNVTSTEGIKSDDSVFGSLMVSKIHDISVDILHGLNVLADETDGNFDIWLPMDEAIADEVCDAMI